MVCTSCQGGGSIRRLLYVRNTCQWSTFNVDLHPAGPNGHITQWAPPFRDACSPLPIYFNPFRYPTYICPWDCITHRTYYEWTVGDTLIRRYRCADAKRPVVTRWDVERHGCGEHQTSVLILNNSLLSFYQFLSGNPEELPKPPTTDISSITGKTAISLDSAELLGPGNTGNAKGGKNIYDIFSRKPRDADRK